jgi:N-acetylmuramoyl-L-alanine amidase
LISLICILGGMLLSNTRSFSGEHVILEAGTGPKITFPDFRRDGEIILIPFQESLERMALSGFCDQSAGAIFIKAAGRLLVVDINTGETAIESWVYKLSRPPLLEGGKDKASQGIWIPQDFFTGPLARALGQEILIKWVRAEESEPAAIIPQSSLRDPVNVIVIDPGHGGGDDLGAEGPGGLLEKDLTLAMALKLKDFLAKEPDLSVILTRTTDRGIALDKRARIANAVKADLFLSLHVNAAEYVHASGFETFFLSLEATDEAARKLAWLENQGLLPEEYSRQAANSNGGGSGDLGLILGDMVQTEHLKDSEFLAGIIQQNLSKVMKSENRGVKQAPFRVLMGANMPAVLVEVGFLTNLEEAKNISSPEYQTRIVRSIAESIIEYKRVQEKRQGLAQRD